MMHAGSLLSCWLGFAQVGLGANLTHWVTLTSFLLAPPLVTGFPWRDTNRSWWIISDATYTRGHRSAIKYHQPQLVDSFISNL